jgi:hypothetical protein
MTAMTPAAPDHRVAGSLRTIPHSMSAARRTGSNKAPASPGARYRDLQQGSRLRRGKRPGSAIAGAPHT